MSTLVRAETAGNLWKVLVKPGDQVRAGDTLFILEVMKTEIHHFAPQDGAVTAVHGEEGQEGINADDVVVELE